MSKIMIIDDDPAMREVMAYMTHASCECRSGSEALEQDGEYSLIFMDWIMPGICGINLVHALQNKFTKAKIVIVSGMDLKEDDTGGYPVLQKPFKIEDLSKYLKEA